MIFELPPAPGTIDIPADDSIIDLATGLASITTNFYDVVTLVNQSGSILVNQNGDTLVATYLRSITTNVIDLGA